jgi:hypothetical protein
MKPVVVVVIRVLPVDWPRTVSSTQVLLLISHYSTKDVKGCDLMLIMENW